MANNTKPQYGIYKEILSEDCKEYYLFLLEFFVKRVWGDRLAKLNQMFFVPTSVEFSFLDFADDDLQVTPVDPLFQSLAGIANEVELFNSGKSVLFAVNHDAATDRNAKMILNICVKKRMPKGIKPDVLVGANEVNLSCEYAALRIEMLQCWKKGLTISKVFENEVALLHNEKITGYVQLYVKISGYGQTITTEFDAPSTKDPSVFMFSADEIDQSLTYKCRKLDPYAIDLKDSCMDITKPPPCPVCMPIRHICMPCEKLGAIQEREMKTQPYKRDCAEKKPRDRKDCAEKKLREKPSKCRVRPSASSELCGKPVVLKVSGLFENGDKKPTVTVTDDAAEDQTDPDYDVFVLRIGKKGLVGAGEKSDIQLEMKTPKGPERKAPIRYETRDMQTEIEKEKEKKKRKKKA